MRTTAKLLVLLTLFGNLLLARSDQGTITGNVVNPEGVVRIEATSLNTGERFTSVADSTGGFTLASLAPGAYRVIIRNEKGTAFARQYIQVQAGEAVRMNAKLEAARPPRIDGRRAGVRPAIVAPTMDLPPMIQQFGESARYLSAVVLVDDNHGWAVGDTHWDQTTRQVKGSILNTTDGGVTWTNQDPGVTVSLNGLFFLNVSQGWVVGDNGTILRTTDGGAHWTQQAVTTADSFSSVFFTDALNGWATGNAPTQYDDFLGYAVGWQASMWHTTDGGQTWSLQTLPANASLLKRVFFVNPTTGFAAGAALSGYDASGDPTTLGAIYGTTDGGHTWNQIYLTSAGFTFTSLYFTDASNGWAAGFPLSSAYTGGCGFHTADGGKTWQPQSLNPEDPFLLNVRDLRMLDGNRGYAVGTAYAGVGGGTAVWRTLDGGATWNGVAMQEVDPLTMEGFWGVAVTSGKVLIVGDRDLTANSGGPWTACTDSRCATLFTPAYISPHYMFEDVFFADRNHGWAAGTRTFSPQLWGQEIFATQDGGQTWASQFERVLASGSSSYLRLDSISFADASNGWAAGSSEAFPATPYEVQLGCIVHTGDGGKTWTDQAGNICTYSTKEYTVIQALDARNAWALSTKQTLAGTVQLAHTTDGGNTWALVDTGVAGMIAVGYETVQGGMRFSDAQHGCFSGWDAVGCTSDGGAHWTKAAINCGYPECYIESHAVALTDSSHGWFGGSGLYQSSDGGANWSVKTFAALGNTPVEALQFPNSTTGWLAGDGGALFQTTDAGADWQPVGSGTSYDLLGLSFVDPTHGWIAGDFGTILSYSTDRNPAGMPAVFAAVNASSYVTPAAPAAWISIFGANLSSTTRGWVTGDFVNGNLPTRLDGVSVLVNGSPAYLSYISPSQINAMIPDGTPTGQVSVQVTNAAGSSGTLPAQVGVYSPALFRLGGGQYVVVQNAKLQLTSTVKPGDIVVLYGTGFGPTNPAIPSATLSTIDAQTASPVTFTVGGIATGPCSSCWAGLIGPGLYQFNIQVPPNAVDGDLVIEAQIGNAHSQSDSLITVSHY